MISIAGKTALVTGASSGIGKSTVELLIRQGAVVYAASRRTEKMKELEKLGAQIIRLDLADEESILNAYHTVKEAAGGIDILINNAGYGSYGAIEDVPMEEAKRQFEVNIFGLAHITKLLLPGMREKGSGKIVNISSIGGKIYTSYGGWYHATKHALEGFSDCLRLETKRFGIEVIIVEPGGILTEWGTIAAKNLRKTSQGGAYAAHVEGKAGVLEQRYRSPALSDPEVIANVISKAVTARKPRTRYAAGYMAKPVLLLRRLVSDRLFDRIADAHL